MKVKIFTAKTEIEAGIIKGVLDSAGIKSFVVSAKENMTTVHLITGPNVPHDIFVEDKMAEKAVAVLKDNN